ncbi:E3 ubiquitin-protein ligase TRIM33 [Pholidichthys leucotaenia]
MTSPVKMEAAGPDDDLSQQCSNCDSGSATCWCEDCSEALCDECAAAHRRVTLTRSHKLLQTSMPKESVSTLPTKFCRLHPSEPLQLLCFTCKEFTCRDCQLTSHMNHSYQFVKEAMTVLRKKVDYYSASVETQRDVIRRSLKNMEIRLQCIEERKALLRAELSQEFLAVQKALKSKMLAVYQASQKMLTMECDSIQQMMTQLKQQQQRHELFFETAKNMRQTNNLHSLMKYSSQG